MIMENIYLPTLRMRISHPDQWRVNFSMGHASGMVRMCSAHVHCAQVKVF